MIVNLGVLFSFLVIVKATMATRIKNASFVVFSKNEVNVLHKFPANPSKVSLRQAEAIVIDVF